jgi:ADP-ribosyl-[dinitrogen reductase] hydrolase
MLKVTESKPVSDAIQGCILGTAVGDAIGLPREGLSARRAARLFGGAPLGHRLLWGHGMISDDTEHTCMVGQALLASQGDPDAFARSLAWKLRWWLLGLPAGVGSATARSILKLWLGFPPYRSGVWSAGNGPAMRSAILGLYAGNDDDLLLRLVRASTVLTHRDPAAEHGALAVALAARYGAMRGAEGTRPAEFLAHLEQYLKNAPLMGLLAQAGEHLQRGDDVTEYAASLGLRKGVSGYINHTVPVALYCWLRWPGDCRTAVEAAVLLGGDTDTTGAIVGALMGATLGAGAITAGWLDGLAEWPRTTQWMRTLGHRLAEQKTHAGTEGQLPLFWPGVLLRNVFFLGVVLVHVLRRWLPPY